MNEYLFYAAFYHWHSQILRIRDILLPEHFGDRTMNHFTDFSIKGVFLFINIYYCHKCIYMNVCDYVLCKAMQGKDRCKN